MPPSNTSATGKVPCRQRASKENPAGRGRRNGFWENWKPRTGRDEPTFTLPILCWSEPPGAILAACTTLWKRWGSIRPPVGRWTKRRIVEAIQDGYIRGLPMQFAGFKDQRLAAAAKRYFGTWRGAVAGLLSRAPPPTVPRVWTRPAVIEAIQTRSQDGVTSSAIWKEGTGLCSAAKKHFGIWRDAARSAGPEPLQKQWSPQLVITGIQARHAEGLALSSAIFQEDARLPGAGLRYFGNWPNASIAAGIDPAAVSAVRRPTEERTATSYVKTSSAELSNGS